MTTSAAIRRKGIPAQEFLKARVAAGKGPENAFTKLVIASGRGHERISKLAEGVPVARAEKVRTQAKLEASDFSEIIGYSTVHYKRLAKDKAKHLRPVASNRLFKFTQVLEHAVDLYDGDLETALRWLKHPNPAFGDQTPMEMLKSEVGADMVDKLITQLELGILPV